MKRILSTLISVFSVSAMACPTFNGTYACEGDGMEQVMTVKTEVINGVTHYTLDDATVKADGVQRPVKYQGGVYDITASCQDSSLNVDIIFDGGEGDNEACGAEKWNLLYSLNFTPNGKNITEKHQATTVCESGKKVPTEMKGSMNCVKQ